MSRCLVLMLLAGPVAAAEPALKLTAKQMRAELEDVRKKYDLPAMGAAVVRPSGVALVEVVGLRKRGDPTPATAEDRFHIGSDTKALTALLVARLVQQKKLAYDMPLEKALPDLARKMHKGFRPVTLEQLLCHRAGLPENPDDRIKVPAGTPVHSIRTTVAKASLAAEPEYAPGTKFVYSNLGYIIVGAICDRAGRADWESQMRKQVFEPLGMKSAGFGAPGTKGKVDQPWPHAERGKPVEPGPAADNPPFFGPAGRVHCTLGDWGKFVADQLRGAAGKKALLPAAAYRKLQEPPAKGMEYTPGGWLYVKAPVGVVIGHDGSNTLNHASVLLVPGKNLGVLVVTNEGGISSAKACHQVRDALLKKLLR